MLPEEAMTSCGSGPTGSGCYYFQTHGIDNSEGGIRFREGEPHPLRSGLGASVVAKRTIPNMELQSSLMAGLMLTAGVDGEVIR